MCNSTNVPSVSLATAVLMQVQEFVNSGQEFSRYDITKALRQKCNDGLLEIPECEDTNPAATYRFSILKNVVDGIFDQLFQNCLANGLPPLKVTFDRQRGYRLFSVDAALASTPVVAAPAQPSAPMAYATNPSNVGGSWSSKTPPASVVVSVPSSTLTDTEIKRRVALYMESCKKLGVQPTLKRIQSAIKRGNHSTGLSCREIANVAISIGYKV